MAGAVDRDGLAVQLVQVGDQIALVLRLGRHVLGLDQIELHAVGGLGQLFLGRGVSAEDQLRCAVDLFVEDLNVSAAIVVDQRAALDIISIGLGIAGVDIPVGVAARNALVGCQLNIVSAQPAGHGLVALLKAIAAVFIDAHRPDQVRRGIDRLIVLDRHIGNSQIPVAAQHIGTHGLGAVRVVNNDRRAVGQLCQVGDQALVRRRLFRLHSVGEARDRAFDFAQGGFDLHGHVLVDGKGIALGPGLAVIGADEEHRALGRAGEGHHGALLDLARGHVRRRRFHRDGLVALDRDLAVEGVAQLQGRIVNADSQGHVDFVADLDAPDALRLFDHSLVDLDRVPLGVLQANVRIGISAVIVIDLGHFEVAQLHIGADVLRRQRTDRRLLCFERHARGFLISGFAQFGQASVSGTRTAADQRIAQADVGRSRIKIQINAAGLILDINVPAVDQGNDTLDRERGAGLAGQGLSDRDGLRLGDLHGVGEACDLALDFAQDGLDLHGHVLGDGKGIALGPGLAVIGAVGNHRALRRAGEGHHGALFDFARGHVRRRRCNGHRQVGSLFLEETEGEDVWILAHPVDGEIAAVVFEILRFAVILRIRALDELAREVSAGRILQHKERILVGGVNKLYVRAVSEQELAFLVDEAELPVFIHRHGQDRRALGDVQLAVGSKACINCDLLVLSVVVIKLFRAESFAGLRIVDDDLVAVLRAVRRGKGGNGHRRRLRGRLRRRLRGRLLGRLGRRLLGRLRRRLLGRLRRRLCRRLRVNGDILAQLPERERLTDDIAVDAGIAAPVGVGHIDAEITHSILGICCSQVPVRQSEQRAFRIRRRADADAVIGGGDVKQTAVRVGELIGSVNVGDRPAIGCGSPGCCELAVRLCRDPAGGCARSVRRRQRPGRAVLRHRDRHGVVGRNALQVDLLPARAVVRRKGGRRHQ